MMETPRPLSVEKREDPNKPPTYALGEPYFPPRPHKAPKRPVRPRQQVIVCTIGVLRPGGIYAVSYKLEGMTPRRWQRLNTVLHNFAVSFRPRLTFLLFPEGHAILDLSPASTDITLELADDARVQPVQAVTEVYRG